MPLRGSKGRVPQPTNTPDTLYSTDRIEILMAVSEGPIKGLVNDRKSLLIGDTQLENDNGDLNFQNTAHFLYPGTADQNIRLATGFAQSTDVVVNLFEGTPVVRQTNSGEIDFLEIRMLVQQLLINNSKGTFENTVEFTVEYKPHTKTRWANSSIADQIIANQVGLANWDAGIDGIPAPVTPNITIRGKTTNNYAKEYKIQVPRIVGDTYDIRVTKRSKESTNEEFTEITWESFQEIDSSKDAQGNARDRDYDYTAILHLSGQASDQFSSIPTFAGIYDGLLVQVPFGYNAEERTYPAGWTWNGAFVEAWTNNPAWILYAIITNNRWGWSSYREVEVDRYSVLEAAKWCDTRIPIGPDPGAPTKPRYSFNAYIQEAMNGKDFARYVAGSFNAAIVDNLDGSVSLIVDKDDAAVAIFAQENITGEFNYSYTDISSRYNAITVAFINPDLNWAEDRRLVEDAAHIAAHGRNALDFVAVGCTDVDEAIRRARYKLITSTTEIESISFKTNRLGQFVAPFDVILVSDPVMGYGISGRIRSVDAARTTLTLRDPVYLEVGVIYKVQLQLPAGPQQFAVTNTQRGSVTTLIVATPVPADLPEKAVFVLLQSENGGIGLPKPYRVLRVDEEDGNPDQYTISAIEINRNKWSAADQNTSGTPPEYSFLNVNVAAPVTNLKAELVSDLTAGGARTQLRLSWTKTGNRFAEYMVYYARNNGPPLHVTSTPGNEVEIPDLAPGNYEFSVITSTQTGLHSTPVVILYTLTDSDLTSRSAVTHLALGGKSQGNRFEGRDVQLVWRANFPGATPEIGSERYGAGTGFYPIEFKDFVVRVYDVATGTVLHRKDGLRDATYTFTFDDNVATGGPRRQLRFDVTIRDVLGRETDPATITVENPRPQTPQVQVRASFNTIFLEWTKPDDLDFAGILVWASTESGFTPSAETLVFDGTNTLAAIDQRTAGTTYHLRFAAYDAFSKADAVPSEEVSVTCGFISIDDLLKDILDESVLTEAFRQRIDLIDAPGTSPGSVNSRILAEAAERTAAIATEATARAQALLDERHLREAAILDTRQTVQDTATSLSQSLSLLNAQINDPASGLPLAHALITAESQTRATRDSALSQQVATLDATLNNPTTGLAASRAYLISKTETLATQDSALSSRIDALNATVHDPATGIARIRADLINEQSARATAVEGVASSLNILSTQVNNASTGLPSAHAAIVEERNARIRADGDEASARVALALQVNHPTTGLSAKLTQVAEVVSGPNGLSSQYTVKIDNNGVVSGFGLASYPNRSDQSPTSEFVVTADRFMVVKPGGTKDQKQSPFTVANGNVYMNTALIGNATINSAQIHDITADKITSGRISTATLTIKGDGTGDAGIVVDSKNTHMVIYDNAGNIRTVIGGYGGDYGLFVYRSDHTPVLTASGLGVEIVGTTNISDSAVSQHFNINGYSASMISPYGGKVMVMFTAVALSGIEGVHAHLLINGVSVTSSPGIWAGSFRAGPYILRALVNAAPTQTIDVSILTNGMNFSGPILTVQEFRR